VGQGDRNTRGGDSSLHSISPPLAPSQVQVIFVFRVSSFYVNSVFSVSLFTLSLEGCVEAFSSFYFFSLSTLNGLGC
jgi:hypothetical protein